MTLDGRALDALTRLIIMETEICKEHGDGTLQCIHFILTDVIFSS